MLIVNNIKKQTTRFLKFVMPFWKKFKNWITVKKAIIIVSSFIVLCLLLKFVAPFGKVSTYNFSQTLPGAENFLSLNKTDDKLEFGGMILKNKNTRFSLNNQKDLKDIKFHLAFKPGQKEIKIGIRGQESAPFVYKTLFFDPLNALKWNKIEENGLVLYQKNKEFDTIESFLNKIPADKKIGTYQIDTNKLVPMIFSKEKGNTVIDTPIRGNATAYILSTDGDLNIKVSKQDINMYDGNDSLTITLSLDGTKIQETNIGDDGFADKSKNQTKVQVGNINVSNAKSGVYKLDFKFDSAGNDSYLSKIEINSSKVIFGGSVLVWNSTPTSFYTDSSKITTSTSWAESIQNLKVDDKADLAIKDIKNKFDFNLAQIMKGKPEDELYKITSPKGNVNFGTSGYFSFSADSFFNPEIIKSQKLTASDTQADIEQNLDFVLTTVPQVKEDNYWLVSDLNLNPADYNLTGDKIFFSFEIPNLDKQGGSLELGEMTVSLTSK